MIFVLLYQSNDLIMKKLGLTLAIISAFSLSAMAQKEVNEAASAPSLTRKGANNISIGIGTGNLVQEILRDAVNVTGNNSATFTATGPLFFKYENLVDKRIGFGFNVAYMKNNINYNDINQNSMGQDYTYNADLSCVTFSVIARFNYHFMDHDKIDPYIGLGIGYRNVKWAYSDNDQFGNTNSNEANIALSTLPSSPFGGEMTFGMRFLPHPNIGLYVEAGIAKGVIQGGLSFQI